MAELRDIYYRYADGIEAHPRQDLDLGLGENTYHDPDNNYMIKDDVRIECQQWEVVKITPKGVKVQRRFSWGLTYGDEEIKQVVHKHAKKWAYPTKQEAMESFVKRKCSQLAILEEQIARVKTAISLTGEKCK